MSFIPKITGLLIVFFIIGLTQPLQSSAAEKKDKSARRNAILMQKMQQDMALEKTNMQAQFDLQKKELDDKNKIQEEQLQKLEKSLVSVQQKNKMQENSILKVNAEKTATEKKLQETQGQLEDKLQNLAEVKSQLKEAQADIKFNDNQRKTLSSNLAFTTKSLSACEVKNTKLFEFGSQLIKIYDKPSAYKAMMQQESFFQLKRVELENILQNQQDKLDAESIESNKAIY